ncbi:integrase [Natrinema sp. CBA1119]|uniref:tyrosine-type recombinase/integrase n=1 Tax=Natrinema sp. CBA1119 TaxID=1608465 RepID=UPI000BF3F722|nr:tyrosine-type recombinase/integrase [Natrinema sp. CBA1119]PGF14365.1 integrase [Natrinema sp. CBA1119]
MTVDDEVHWLKPDQVDRLRDAAHDGRHPTRDDAIVTILYDTALRRAELSSVNRAMLDLEEEKLRIPGRIQKDYPTDRSPRPAMFELDQTGGLGTISTLTAYLETRDDEHIALFPSQKSSRLSPKAINDVVQRCAKRADVRPFSFEGRGTASDVSAHTLRHSVPWRMLQVEDGNTLYDVRNRLRHRTVLTTERAYDHFETI